MAGDRYTYMFLQRSDRKFLIWLDRDDKIGYPMYTISLTGSREVHHLGLASLEKINIKAAEVLVDVCLETQKELLTVDVDGDEHHFYIATFTGTPTIRILAETTTTRWVDGRNLSHLLRREDVIPGHGLIKAFHKFQHYQRCLRQRQRKQEKKAHV